MTCSRAGTLTLKKARYPAAMTGVNASGGSKTGSGSVLMSAMMSSSGLAVLIVTDSGSGKSGGDAAWRTK